MLILFLFVLGPHPAVLGDYSWWEFGGTIWDTRDWTQIDCIEGKYPTHSTITLTPKMLTWKDGCILIFMIVKTQSKPSGPIQILNLKS